MGRASLAFLRAIVGILKVVSRRRDRRVEDRPFGSFHQGVDSLDHHHAGGPALACPHAKCQVMLRSAKSSPKNPRTMLAASISSSSSRSAKSGVLRRFAIDQRAFAIDTPSIARERAIVANHPMAGNSDSEFVGGAGSCHAAD
jgi:hypothetical protein